MELRRNESNTAQCKKLQWWHPCQKAIRLIFPAKESLLPPAETAEFFSWKMIASLLLNLLFYKWSIGLTLLQGLVCKIFWIHCRIGHSPVLTGHKRVEQNNISLPEQVKNLNVAISTIGSCTVTPTWSNYVQGSANTTPFQKSSFIVWGQKQNQGKPMFSSPRALRIFKPRPERS